MFKKSKRKIVAAIMSALALLFLGTLAVIYVSSYREVSSRNRESRRCKHFRSQSKLYCESLSAPLPSHSHRVATSLFCIFICSEKGLIKRIAS